MALTDGLKFFLECEEATGATRLDATGNGHNFTSDNSVTQVTGKVGNAAGFVTNKRLWCASHADLQPGPDFTLAFWLFVNADTGCIALKDDVGSGRQWEADVDGLGLRFIVFDSVSGLSIPANISLNLGEWNFFILKYKSADKKPYSRVNNGTANVGSALTNGILANGTSPFEFGDRSAAAAPLNGRLDQIAYYQRFTSDAEDTEWWNSGAGLSWADIAPVVAAGGRSRTHNNRRLLLGTPFGRRL